MLLILSIAAGVFLGGVALLSWWDVMQAKDGETTGAVLVGLLFTGAAALAIAGIWWVFGLFGWRG